MSKPSNKKQDYDKMRQRGLLSSGFIKPYVVNKKDENGHIVLDEDGNPVKETSKISRSNPDGCQECQMDMRLESLKIERQQMEEKKRKDLAIKQVEERRRLHKKQRQESRAALEAAKRNTDATTTGGIVFEMPVTNDTTAAGLKKASRRKNTPRPSNWREIGEYYNNSGNNMKSTINEFYDELCEKDDDAMKQAIRAFGKQCKTDYEVKDRQRYGVLGEDIEKELKKDFDLKREAGIAVTNQDLQQMVKLLVIKHNLQRLYATGCTFGYSWVQRWCKRFNITDRVVTTKMREELDPEILQRKDESYKEWCGRAIAKFAICLALVFGLDETNVQFYPRARNTLDGKGKKRVRALGVGDKEKMNCTCTVIHNFEGDIADPQLIFKGSTNRCLPFSSKGEQVPPELYGTLFSHSPSHWQNPDTYIELLTKLFIPFKNQIIKANKLPLDSWVLLIHDLHYSHKDPSVIDFLRKNRITHVYIPAGCTDLRQICDVVINKIFKGKVRDEFRQDLHNEFERWIEDGNEASQWNAKLDYKHVKNRMPMWVMNAIKGCREELREPIKSAGLKSGLMEEIMNPQFLDRCRMLNETQPMPEYDDKDEEVEDEEHDMLYEGDDDFALDEELEEEVIRNIAEPLTLRLNRNLVNNAIAPATEKCCCGRNDKYHLSMASLHMDHVCSGCKGSCYGLCTEEYLCYRCSNYN